MGCSYQACLSLSMRLVSQHNRWTHWAFINSIVNLSKESLAQDPSHNEILLGDLVPFCTQKQRHRLRKLHVSLFQTVQTRQDNKTKKQKEKPTHNRMCGLPLFVLPSFTCYWDTFTSSVSHFAAVCSFSESYKVKLQCEL